MTRKSIVVGYDGTHTSREALIWALHSAEQRGLRRHRRARADPAVGRPGRATASPAVAQPENFEPFAEALLREAGGAGRRDACRP